MNRMIYLMIISVVLLWLAGGIDGAINQPSITGMEGAGTSMAFHIMAIQGVGTTLASQFTYEPFTPAMPDHIWMDAGNGEIRFFQFDKPITEEDARLIFIGEGIRGIFCASNQPDAGKAGFVHFHSLKAAIGGNLGHGGHAGSEGYWLRHVAVGEFDLMGTHFTPGIAMNFMPTPPPKC